MSQNRSQKRAMSLQHNHSDNPDNKKSYFPLLPSLACILESLCNTNDALLAQRKSHSMQEQFTLFHGVKPPEISLLTYLMRLCRYAQCSWECFVCALIYIDRIIKAHPEVIVSSFTVHRLLLTGVMCAAKFSDDVYLSNGCYARIGGVENKEINALELEFLFLADFELYVAPDVYKQYWTEICEHARMHCAKKLKNPQLLSAELRNALETQTEFAKDQGLKELLPPTPSPTPPSTTVVPSLSSASPPSSTSNSTNSTDSEPSASYEDSDMHSDSSNSDADETENASEREVASITSTSNVVHCAYSSSTCEPSSAHSISKSSSQSESSKHVSTNLHSPTASTSRPMSICPQQSFSSCISPPASSTGLSLVPTASASSSSYSSSALSDHSEHSDHSYPTVRIPTSFATERVISPTSSLSSNSPESPASAFSPLSDSCTGRISSLSTSASSQSGTASRNPPRTKDLPFTAQQRMGTSNLSITPMCAQMQALSCSTDGDQAKRRFFGTSVNPTPAVLAH